MVRSAATSVGDYLRQLPEDRRAVIESVRTLIRENLPAGYEESVSAGMLCYAIPLTRYPHTYNGQPLAYVSLASQKNYCALYLMPAYGSPKEAKALADGFAKAGKKLDMGKSCVRFRKLDDLALDAIAKIVASMTPEEFIAMYEKNRSVSV